MHALSLKNDILIQRFQAERTLCERIKGVFTRKSELQKKIEALDLPSFLQGLQSKQFRSLRPALRSFVLKYQNREHLFYQVAGAVFQNKELLNKFLSLCSLKDLKHPAQNLEQLASAYNIEIGNENKISIKRACWLFEMLKGAFKTVSHAFSFFKIGREPAGSWEASHILDVYGKIFGFPLLLFTALAMALPPLMALVITTAIVTLVLLGVYVYSKSKKKINAIVYFINLTVQALIGKLGPVLARDDIVSQMLYEVAQGRRPVILGMPGVGKTELFNAIAQWIARDDPRVPESLRGKTVFLVNTARLLSDSFAPDLLTKLQRVRESIGKQKDEVILCFDEIHVAYQGSAELGTELNSILDNSAESLPYCIAATTEEAYKKFVASKPDAARRATEFVISSTDKVGTLSIIKQMSLRDAGDLEISPKEIEALFDAKEVQPDAAKKTLSLLISQKRKPPLTEAQQLFKNCQSNILNLKFDLQRADTQLARQYAFKIAKLERIERDLKEILETERKEYQCRRAVETDKRAYKNLLTKLANELGVKRDKEKLKTFAFVEGYLVPFIESLVIPHHTADVEAIKKELELAMKNEADEQVIR